MSRHSNELFDAIVARYSQRTRSTETLTVPPWHQFAAAAGASLALSATGEAAIQHTDLPTPVSIDLANQSNSTVADDFDLNDDGQDDIRFQLMASTTIFSLGSSRFSLTCSVSHRS